MNNDGGSKMEKEVEAVVPNLEFDLDKYIYKMLVDEVFFTEISRHIEKRPTTAIPTAGVRVTKEGQFEMLYNPAFFQKLSVAHRIGVLKHEYYHLVLGHVTDRLPEGKMSRRWNIATDLAINSHLDKELPEFCCFPGRGPFKDLPGNMASEWYYNMLPKQSGQSGSGGDGKVEGSGGEGDSEGQFDSHGEWGNGTGEVDDPTRELAKERLREMMRSAADVANKSSNGWGSISQSLRKDILTRITGKIDWRSVLRYFIKVSQRADKTSTVKRLNKRYAYIHPGKKVNRHAKIAVSIDQSGSVGDEMLAAFFSELNSLSKIATFTVIPFDTEVFEDKVYVWKKGMQRKAERVLYGGTDFSAPTAYVNKHCFDGHIILTDMQAPKPINSKCQRMWMTTRACMDSKPFATHERVIPVE